MSTFIGMAFLRESDMYVCSR